MMRVRRNSNECEPVTRTLEFISERRSTATDARRAEPHSYGQNCSRHAHVGGDVGGDR